MNNIFGLDTLPGPLPRLLGPWARALSEADVANAHWLREATEVGVVVLGGWIKSNAQIDTALRAARLGCLRVADALDARRDASALKAQAQDALRTLVEALRLAQPTDSKAALGLGW